MNPEYETECFRAKTKEKTSALADYERLKPPTPNSSKCHHSSQAPMHYCTWSQPKIRS